MSRKKDLDAAAPAKTLTFGKMLSYGIGIFGIQMCIGMLNTYQSQFYTSVLGAELTKCALIILLAKIVSSLADPVIGNIIDAAHFKSGKMKPFVAMSILPFAAITMLMFVAIDFKSDLLMYGYITLTTVLWNMVMSFAEIPSQGMLAVLSPSSDEKSSAAGISNMLKSMGLVVCNGVVPVVCILTKSAVITKKEYMLSAGVIALAACIFVAIMLKGTKEVIKSEPQGMSFKNMFIELKENKPLLIIFLINMLGFGRNMAVTIGVQAAAVLFDKVTIGPVTLSGENLPIILGVGAMVTSLLSISTIPMVAKKIGTKKSFMIYGVYGFVVSVLSYIFFVFTYDAGNPGKSFWVIFAIQFLTNFMFGPHGYAPLVMLSDAVDYKEMTTGKRTEGVQYSVLVLSIKLANAFSVALGIFMVGLSGYVGTMTYPEVTTSTRNIVMAAYWLVPGICVGLSMIPMLFYKLDKPEIQAQLKEFMAKRTNAEENEE